MPDRSASAIFYGWLLAAAGTAVMAWSASSEAQPVAGISLRWVAPSSCPDAQNVRARIRQLLPDEVASGSRELVAEGTVVPRNGRYRLTLNVHRETESGVARVFDSDSCDSLAGAAAVTLALLARGARGVRGSDDLRGGGTEVSPEDGGAPAPGTAPAPATPPTSPPTTASARPQPASTASAPRTNPSTERAQPATPEERPAPTAARSSASVPASRETAPDEASRGGRPRRPWGVALGAPLLAVDEGTLPSWAYGAGLSAGVRLSRVRLMVAGRLWLPQTRSAGAFEAKYQRWNGELSGCYALLQDRFDLGPCAVMTLEDVTAHGSGPQVSPGPGHADWLTLGLAVRAGWSPTPWAALFLRPSLTFATSRPTFAIEGVGPLYRVPLATVGVDLGCEWIL